MILGPCIDDLWYIYDSMMHVSNEQCLLLYKFLHSPSSLTCTHDHVGGNIDSVPKGKNLKVLQKSEVAFIQQQQAQVWRSNWHSEMHPKMKTSKSHLKNNSYLNKNSWSCQRSPVWLLMLVNASWGSSMIPNLKWFAIILYMILDDSDVMRVS